MRSSPGFVGRVTERNRLLRLLRGEHAGALICGSYGIGKTRLVREALAECRDLRVGWLATTDVPLVSRFDPRAGSRVVTDVLELEASRFDLLVVDEVDQLCERGVRTVRAAVERADLRVIGLRCDHATRPGLVDDALPDLVEFRLDPLPAEDVAALAQATLGGPVGVHTLADLLEVCAGYPAFVQEVLTDARGRGILRQGEDGVFRLHGDFEVPAHLASDLRFRLSDLTQRASEVLDLVAIAGRIPLSAIVRVGSPAVCRELERRSFVRVDHQGATIACAHPVLAQTVLAGQAPAARVQRHRQLVALLRHQPGTDPVDLARWSRATGTGADPALLLAGSRAAAARLDLGLAVELASNARMADEAGNGSFPAANQPTVDPPCSEGDAWSDAARTHGASFSEMVGGRLREAEAPLDRTIEVLRGEPYPEARLLELQLEFVRHHVRVSRGEFAAARRQAEDDRSAALAAHDRVAAGVFAANLGHVARFQGDLRTADCSLSDAEHELALLDPLNLRAQLAGHRAIVAAEFGRRAEVASLLGRIDTGPGPALIPREVLRCRVLGWLSALDRDPCGVQENFGAAVRIATEGQQPLLAMFAAHSAVRLGFATEFLDDLAAAATGIDAALAPMLVAHARAVVAGDALELTASAHRLAGVGAALWAAESFVLAAHAHGADDAGSRRRCLALARFIRPGGSEGAWILGGDEGEPGLATREREVAALAAAGVSNHEIASALGLSSNTVDAQLRSVFKKLGVTRRGQIPASPRGYSPRG